MFNPNGTLLSQKINTGEGSDSQKKFVERNHVAKSYKGPVFVVEDVWVQCSKCCAAVDPVVRIPVGHMWFHPACLRCAVCNVVAGTRVFTPVKGVPVCSECMRRGFSGSIKKQSRSRQVEAARLPSAPGSFRPSTSQTQRITMTPQATPARLMDARTTTPRQQQLIERQQMLMSHDNNILMLPPVPSASRRSSSRTPQRQHSPVRAIEYSNIKTALL